MGHGIIRTGVLALMLGMAAPASAFRMYGGQDCGQWLKEGGTAGRLWLAGFMSGINALYTQGATNPTTDPLAKTNSAQQIFAWMDNYCRANPLATVESGAMDLYSELLKKK